MTQQACLARLAVFVGLLVCTLAARGGDVGVSISIGQPGFYGRVDLGYAPPPQLIYAEPMYVVRPARVVYDPIYLRVPPGHERRWAKHCHYYGACGRPVYFVRDNWYRDVYIPHYQRLHGDRRYWHDRQGWRDEQHRRHWRDRDDDDDDDGDRRRYRHRRHDD